MHTSGPTPRRSATPGRNPSVSPSALSIKRRARSTPSGFFKSTATDRRPRFIKSTCACSCGGYVARSCRSIRMMSAPASASIIPAKGAGPIPANSTIRTPVSGPVIDDLSEQADDSSRPAIGRECRQWASLMGVGSACRDAGLQRTPGSSTARVDRELDHTRDERGRPRPVGPGPPRGESRSGPLEPGRRGEGAGAAPEGRGPGRAGPGSGEAGGAGRGPGEAGGAGRGPGEAGGAGEGAGRSRRGRPEPGGAGGADATRP